jgi:ornithine decarboxylase
LLLYITTHPPALDKLRNAIVQHAIGIGSKACRSSQNLSRNSSSFYIVSPAAIQRQVAIWKEELPTITPYYAVKSNPDSQILNELHRNGVKYDCASSREIRDCEAFSGAGLAVSKDILFANPTKTDADMRLAAQRGITETVVDCPEEVWRIAHTGWRPNIFIRLAVDDMASRSPFSIKFGAEKRSWKSIIGALEITGLKLAGLSFHIGSASSDATQYTRAIELCRRFSYDTGKYIEAVDIGGGFMPETFAKAAAKIRRAVKDWETSTMLRPPTRWIAEPGRFFSGVTHTLFTQVIGAKDGPGGVGWRYTIDESIYGQFSCIPFDHQRPHWRRVGGNRDEKGRGFLFGRTCDSLDLIAYSEKMARLKAGDWLCFPGMGAYTTSSSSEFNGFPRPRVYYQDEGWLDPGKLGADPDVVFPIETRSSINLSLGREDTVQKLA